MTTSTASKTRAGRPPKIDRKQVIHAALDIAESRGLESLSIRAVAAELGVVPMTVYGHVEGIDELIELVVTEIVGQNHPDFDWPSDWEGVLSVAAHSLRAMLLAHPVILQAYQRRSVVSAQGIEEAERVLAALSAAGLDDDTALDIWIGVIAFVAGFVAVEHGRAAAHVTDERVTEVRNNLDRYLEEHGDEYPTLRRLGASRLTWRFNEEQFERCLSSLLAALRGRLRLAGS